VDPTLLTISLTASITLVIATVALGFRDQWVSRRSAVGEQTIGQAGLTAPAGPTTLQPLPLSPSLAATRSTAGKIDRWFDRLTIESGVDLLPVTLFLMAVAGALLVGGSLWIWQPVWYSAALGGATGVVLILGLFLFLRRRRCRAMQAQLPDVMQLIAQAVRAGESADQAIALVGQSAIKPLGIEFRRASRQLDMGLSMDAAMRSLVHRVPLTEMRIFAATLRVQRKSGGNLPGTLERLVQVVRGRISYERQFRAATAAARTSTLVIAMAAPTIIAYMLIWRREYVTSLLQMPQGQAILGLAIALQVAGLAWIFRLLRSEF
jgi:tight adherence protein B